MQFSVVLMTNVSKKKALLVLDGVDYPLGTTQDDQEISLVHCDPLPQQITCDCVEI